MIDELPPGVAPSRVTASKGKVPGAGRYVLYWMQQSARARCNHALEYAAHQANLLGLPLVVYFGLTPDYPGANLRHYRFLIEGLVATAGEIEARGGRFVPGLGDPAEGAIELAKRAALCVVDRGYLRIQRKWRASVAARIAVPFVEVESDVVVPVETASEKEEYAAATIRRKLHRLIGGHLVLPERVELERSAEGLDLASIPLDVASIEGALPIDRTVSPAPGFRGGSAQAAELLDRFIRERLPGYAEHRNDPSRQFQSELSPYLHFGQISPIEIALAVLDDEAAQDRFAIVDGGWNPGRLSKDAVSLLEELIVRRELAMNFVRYSPSYDSIVCLPGWARRSLDEHRDDPREPRYSRERLEAAATGDEYWNAAQREMVVTGKMHGYLRMYWGKKVIEWSSTPEEAYRTLVELNDRYSLDGRDPNGYAGIAWCFGKHDRPWQERPIFGKVRYMNARGLERKFDMSAYLRRIDALG